jgi:hypothetical protein
LNASTVNGELVITADSLDAGKTYYFIAKAEQPLNEITGSTTLVVKFGYKLPTIQLDRGDMKLST